MRRWVFEQRKCWCNSITDNTEKYADLHFFYRNYKKFCEDTVIQLLIGGGNIFISGCLLLIKISYWIFSAIMGLFAICSRSGVMGIITAVFAGISTALSWLWVKFCMLFLMWSMRQNEYLADEFAYKIGFGLELATVLDQHISDVPHDGFLSAIYSTHPCNDDRVAALQNLGVPYSRY